MMSFNIVDKVIKSKCRTQDNTKIENMTRCNISRESKVEIYRLGKFPENIADLLLYGERPLTGIFFPWSRCAQGKARQVDPKPMATLWRDSVIHLRSLWGHLFYTLLLSIARCCGSDCDLLSPHNAHCMLQLLHMIHHKLNTFHSYILLISIPKQSTLQHTMHPGFCTNQNEFSLLLTVFSICILDRVAPLTVKRGLIAEESEHPVLRVSLS